jgi:hypothetical protein
MLNLLIWVYIANSTLLIVHEIDSAYWQEWKLFKLPGGLTLFLVLHIPLAILVLVGLLLVAQGNFAGLIISIVLGLMGIFAFSIHVFFLKRGHPEFKTPVSIFILIATFVLSILQLGVTTLIYFTG